MARLQGRLARVPRWAWILFFVGVLLPIVVLGVAIVAVGLVTGLIVMAAALLVSVILGAVYRLMHRRGMGQVDDGRRNVQIVVRSARVIDP